ncbi:MAG: biosynthetic arginine decarboxylase [Bdellovibrionales bacterium]
MELVNRASERTSVEKLKTETQPATPTLTPTPHKAWTVEDSEAIYGIKNWGAGYFKINPKGRISITPHGPNGAQVDLLELIEDLRDRGIRTPILVRFPDIVKSRIHLLNSCFDRAIKEYGYNGRYCGVYPIKVNQQKHLVKEIVSCGAKYNLGLECGSKPELLVVLGLMNAPDALIIANGFKDEEYIETALLSQKLGRNTIIVVDRYSELQMILAAAKKVNAKPRIGFRAKLESKGSGRWIDSSGARSKFGLTPAEIVQGVELLKQENMLDCLELLHFHIGSQISSIQAIKSSLKEGTRFLAELYALGARPKYIDVGGGLGVDYDGSGASDSSINYSEQEYANDVVSTIQAICDERKIPHPNIVTESGRSLVAHHSVLVFDVLGVNEVAKMSFSQPVDENDHKITRSLHEIYEGLKLENIRESYHDSLQFKEEALQLFTLGYLSLTQRAKIENLLWAINTKVAKLAATNEDYSDIIPALSQDITDTYFCNFSIFQSTPDTWAVEQLFPIMPIHRLSEEPRRKAVLVDLTCDSDGKLDRFISNEQEKKNALEVHYLQPNTPYFLGAFLIGAYQEILGDLHNLFGDTDAVHINITEAGYTVEDVVEGDSVAEVLSYVQYERSELVDSIRRAAEAGIQRGTITKQEARLLLKHYEEGLAGYTYLE